MIIDVELKHHAECTEYIYVSIRGTAELTECQSVSSQIATAIEELNIFSILLDVRMVECPLSYGYIIALIADLSTHRAALSLKIAVLYCEDGQGKASRFLELYAGNRGYHIRTFTICDQTLHWLGRMNATENT